MHAKLIANPMAGDAKTATKRLEEAAKCLLDQGIKVDVALAKPKSKATPIAKKAVKDGYKIIIAMGGDGTIEAVMRGMVGSKARLGIIPGGTANNIAKSLGIPEDLPAACALIATDQNRKLDVGQLKSKKNRKFHFFELTAIGLTAALYPDTKDIQKKGLAGIKDAAEALLRHEPKPTVRLTLDGESKIEVQTMLVTVANTPMWGVNFLVAPDASLRDGLLDIAVYPEFSKVDILAYLSKVMKEGYTPDGRIQRYRAKKIKVKSDPKLEVMADGVMQGKGTVKIKILPKALRTIAPPASEGVAKTPKEADQALPAPVSPVAEPVASNQ
ncbi:MAG: diacylglycerol/lipid kinase family protein [Omnitrophica WOR_2 bacterium]